MSDSADTVAIKTSGKINDHTSLRVTASAAGNNVNLIADQIGNGKLIVGMNLPPGFSRDNPPNSTGFSCMNGVPCRSNMDCDSYKCELNLCKQ
jgi:hypothetical protein